ncbi:hypothetical protein H6P81_020310 [Aristolochia fimbriata]|uniref:Pentatricopeptide repeat-containing protein n=1 Tax=Aristolochia fimbriata TaxID=158543 RepID=A0AAV7DU61_ARIFI|nr:hypothetical protein H6P81_020310 [Aristolochia fimbriata]
MLRYCFHSPLLDYFPIYLKKRSIHATRIIGWKLKDEYRLPHPLLLERICRILTLQRFQALSGLSFDFSDELLGSVLRNLKHNPDACLPFFQLALAQRTFQPSTNSYCKIIHILSKGRIFNHAKAYLKRLIEISGPKDVVSVVFDELVLVYKEFSFSPTVFDMLLKMYSEMGSTKKALFVFDNMGKIGCNPSLRSCNCLLSCLVKSNESCTAFHVYDQMASVQILPDIYTYTIMVNAYCKESRVEKVFQLFVEMEISYSTLLDGFFKNGKFEDGLKLWKQMLVGGFVKSQITVNTMINALCKIGKMTEAEGIFRQMKNWGCQPDSFTYRTLIDGHCKLGAIESAFKIRKEMETAELSPSLEMFNSLISGFFKVDKHKSLNDLLVEMQMRGLKIVDFEMFPGVELSNKLLNEDSNIPKLYAEMHIRELVPSATFDRQMDPSTFSIAEEAVICDTEAEVIYPIVFWNTGHLQGNSNSIFNLFSLQMLAAKASVICGQAARLSNKPTT